MFRIDGPTAAQALPAPSAVSGAPGFFTAGDPAATVPATDVSADWLNTVQEELVAIVAAGGQQPDKTKRNQVLAAIRAIIASGGVSFASVDEALAGTVTNEAMSPATSAALVADRIAALVGGAPALLNTLGELAAAIGGDPNFAANVAQSLAGRALAVRQIAGGGLASGGGDLLEDRVISVTAASGTELNAGTEAGKALTPAAYAAGGGGDGSTGWAPLPGGNIIQWGTQTVIGNGSSVTSFTIAFPRAFINVCGSIVGSAEPMSGSWRPLVAMFNAPSIAGVSGILDSTDSDKKFSGGRILRWQAIGR